MRDDAKVNFDPLSPAGTSTQDRRQVSFEPGDRALGLDALPVFAHRKAFVHLTPILGLGPTTTATLVQLDNRAADAQLFPRIGVVGFGVVAPVGQEAVDEVAADESGTAGHDASHRNTQMAEIA